MVNAGWCGVIPWRGGDTRGPRGVGTEVGRGSGITLGWAVGTSGNNGGTLGQAGMGVMGVGGDGTPKGWGNGSGGRWDPSETG